MTRVNCVPPDELSRQHLLAEAREIPRIIRLARKAWDRGERHDDPRNPQVYTLGKGHVRFFYSRLGFILVRMYFLQREIQHRGYSHEVLSGRIEDARYLQLCGRPSRNWWRHWDPDEAAMAINRARILERTK